MLFWVIVISKFCFFNFTYNIVGSILYNEVKLGKKSSSFEIEIK